MSDGFTVQIDPRSIAAMKRMQGALAMYSANSSRSPAKFIADASSKLMLGEDIDGGGHNDGLFHRIAALAPRSGQATEEAKARGFRMGRSTSTSLSIARAKVNELLGRGESGAFKVVSGKSRSALTLGSIYTRGRRKGELNFRARGDRLKTQEMAVGVSRASAKASGGALLNRQAAITAFALRRREAARMADAAQFLPSRYRRTIAQLKGVAYRGGQAVGLPGGSADSSRFHLHETALVQNAKGRVLGAMTIVVSSGDASATIIGRLGLHTSAEQSALADSMNMVGDYALRRVLSRIKDDAAQFHRWMQLDAARP